MQAISFALCSETQCLLQFPSYTSLRTLLSAPSPRPTSTKAEVVRAMQSKAHMRASLTVYAAHTSGNTADFVLSLQINGNFLYIKIVHQ